MRDELLKIGAGVLLVAVVLWGANYITGPCGIRCNVILIMVDTLSGEHIGTYGYDRDTMPEVTAFFEKRGVIFDNATSNATWTLPSFTGMYFSDIASRVTYAELSDGSRPSLQSALRADDVTIRAIRPSGENFIFDAITRLYNKDEIIPATEFKNSIELGTEEYKKLSTSDNPFFLLVHTFEVHDPYNPDAPYNELFGQTEAYPTVTMNDVIGVNAGTIPVTPTLIDTFRLRYDQQLAQADHHIATFLNNIAPSVLSRTVIILAADHGESFYEHGSVWHGGNGLYQSETHIPLMMMIPGVMPGRISETVSLADIAPTVLSFMKIPAPKEFTGENLLPLIQGDSLEDRVIPLITGFPFYLSPKNTKNPPKTLDDVHAVGANRAIVIPKSYGARIGMQKLFVQIDPETAAETWHWYDLAKDPAEKNNLAAHPDTALPKNLKDAVDRIRRETKPE